MTPRTGGAGMVSAPPTTISKKEIAMFTVHTNRCKQCDGHYTEYDGGEDHLCPVCNLQHEAGVNGDWKRHIKMIRDILDLMERQYDS